MSLLTPYPIQLDSLVIGTHAIGLYDVGGLHGAPDVRDEGFEVQYVAGEIPEYDVWPRARTRKFKLWIAGCDEDGVITHPSGERGHIEETLRSLSRIINKQGAPIAFQQTVPTLAGGTEVLTGNCKKGRAVEVGGTRGLRRIDLELRFPYPFLHGALTDDLGNSGSFNLDTSASDAPIYDAIVTFKSGTDQRLTINEGPWSGQYVQWIGSPGASGVRIDMGAGTVVQLPGGTNAIGGLRHNMANWLTLPYGDAALSCTLTGGGTVDVSYYAQR